MTWTLVSTALIVALAAPAGAASFTDYRIPDHHGFRFDGDVGADALRLATYLSPRSARRSEVQGRGFGSVEWFRDSDRLQHRIGLQAFADGRRDREELDRYSEYVGPGGSPVLYDWGEERQSVRVAREGWHLAGSGRWYPGTRSLGIGGSARGGGSYNQQWSSELRTDASSGTGGDFRYESSGNLREDSYTTQVSAEAQAGWGRVRDATPAFEALVVEERLAQAGALARPLSASARARLAQLLALRKTFGVAHEFPERAFWREVERLAAEDGALGGAGLDAYAAFRIAEPLVVAPAFRRQVGWFAGPVAVLRHSHSIQRSYSDARNRSFTGGALVYEGTASISSRSTASDDRLQMGVAAEFHRPLTDRVQFDAYERALVDRRGPDHGTWVYGQAGLQRLVAERWLLSGLVAHTRELEQEPRPWSWWVVEERASVAWYLEDRLFLACDLSDRRSHVADNPTGGPSSVSSSTGLSLRLGYGRGRLDAPGVIPPIRPLD